MHRDGAVRRGADGRADLLRRGLITFAADHWDDELKRTFGGQTFFEGSPADEAPPDPGETEAHPTAEAEAEPGGYL